MLWAPFGDGWAAYDLVTREVVIVSAMAGWVVGSPGVAIEVVVAEAVDVLGASPEEVEGQVREAIAQLIELGLLGREGPPLRAVGLVGQPLEGDGTPVGAIHPVLDERLVFRSSDVRLLAEIDAHLGSSTSIGTPTLVFDVEPHGPEVVLRAAEEWHFPSREGFFRQLPGVIHDFASHATSMLVLHAGAVRTPAGRVLVLPGIPEAGKSTLTAALVQRGSDYLGDEVVGVREGSLQAVGHPRALVLDAGSREALGLVGLDEGDPYVDLHVLNPRSTRIHGDAGPVARIILPTYDPAATPAASQLSPVEALEQMLRAVMNLERGLEVSWRTLCQLAEGVTVSQITHGSSSELADLLLAEEGASAPPDASHARSAFPPTRSSGPGASRSASPTP